VSKETNTRTPAKTPIVITTPTPAPGLEPAATARGTQVAPFHCHNRSGETAGFHSAPFHHQNPSDEKRVFGGALGACL